MKSLECIYWRKGITKTIARGVGDVNKFSSHLAFLPSLHLKVELQPILLTLVWPEKVEH